MIHNTFRVSYNHMTSWMMPYQIDDTVDMLNSLAHIAYDKIQHVFKSQLLFKARLI